MTGALTLLALVGCQAEGNLDASAPGLDAVKADVGTLTAEVETLRSEVATLRSDVEALSQALAEAESEALTEADLDGLAAEDWVAQHYTTPAQVDQAITAALPAEALATEPWVAERYATPDQVDQAVTAALPAEALATEPWVQERFATPGDVGDAIDAALPATGTLTTEEWVVARYVPFAAIGDGLLVDDGGQVLLDATEVRGLAFDTQQELTGALDGVYVAQDYGSATNLLLGMADGPCEDDQLGTIEYRDGGFFGCSTGGWTLLGGRALGSFHRPASSCLAILDADPDAASGAYWLQRPGETYPAYCDMETDGGGWTVAGWQSASAATSLGLEQRGSPGEDGFSTDLEGIAFSEILVFNRTYDEWFSRAYAPATWGSYTLDMSLGTMPDQFRQGVYGDATVMICIDFSHGSGSADIGCDNDGGAGQKGHLAGFAGEFCSGGRLDGTWAWTDGSTCRYRGLPYQHGFAIR